MVLRPFLRALQSWFWVKHVPTWYNGQTHPIFPKKRHIRISETICSKRHGLGLFIRIWSSNHWWPRKSHNFPNLTASSKLSVFSWNFLLQPPRSALERQYWAMSAGVCGAFAVATAASTRAEWIATGSRTVERVSATRKEATGKPPASWLSVFYQQV